MVLLVAIDGDDIDVDSNDDDKQEPLNLAVMTMIISAKTRMGCVSSYCVVVAGVTVLIIRVIAMQMTQ